MKSHQKLIHSVGILGGGQLSLMLSQAALRMGLRPLILTEDSFAPTARVYPHCIFGSIHDEEVLSCFFSQVDTVVFENEFVNCSQLKRVAAPFGTSFYPNLDVIELLQDKLNQKNILMKLKIPTAPYVELDLDEPLNPQLKSLLQDWGGALILKWSRMGYDGKGVLFMKDRPEDFVLASQFTQSAIQKQSRVYAERKIDFKTELSLIATQGFPNEGVHASQAEIVTYPLTVSEQDQGVCNRVYGPATSFGIPHTIENQAQLTAKKLAHHTGLVGTFALEYFLTSAGELIVNEIAPRVHNSGHYTQNTCAADQFENHWRAVLGLPLGSSHVKSFYAMLNLLGPDIPELLTGEPPLPVAGNRTHLYWYGKAEIRPRRKLGHLNGNVYKKEDVESLFSELERCKQVWISKLLRKVEVCHEKK